MNRLTPLAIGIITGAIMLALSLVIYYMKALQLSSMMYILYAAGIVWALMNYYRSGNYTPKFGSIFGQGFRCFIIVTLIMVVFTGIFFASHPEFAEQDGNSYKEYLQKEVKDKTPLEKDEMVATYKKYYTTRQISTAIFGYLILGSAFTAAGAGILLLRRK